MACPSFQICPPRSARSTLQAEPIFYKRQRPVAGHFEADGPHATGIAFSDYTKMHCDFHKQSGKRHKPMPLWTQNDVTVRRVLLRYLEGRCYSKKQWKAFTGDERSRFLNVMVALKQKSEPLAAHIDKLMAEYPQADSERRKILNVQIMNLDRSIRLAQRPDVFLKVIRLYYRVCFDSCGVAQECGMSSAGVRQVLSRLNKTARSLGYS